ncbi:hypothetical protein ABFX02_09G108900 [Erythranthe guttata]
MSFRGRGGRGGGRGGRFGGGGGPRATPVPFELFPDIADIGKAEKCPVEKHHLIKWSMGLQAFSESSPYYYEDQGELSKKVVKPDIERYSDRDSLAKRKRTIEDSIKLGEDYMPRELVRGDKKGRRAVKRVRWNPDSAWQRFDMFDRREQKGEGKEDEDEEDEDEEVEDDTDGEFSDEGDYEQNEDFDDDEDDFNMAEENEEPYY